MSTAPRHIDVTIDVVLFCVEGGELKVVLTPRSKEPFAGQPALPGGYVHAQEDDTSEAAAYRMLKEKLGLCPGYLEQLQTYASSKRDPRGWSASIAYYALVSSDLLAEARGGSERFSAVAVDVLPARLAFDHDIIIKDALERLRTKSNYSTLPLFLAGKSFTLNDLQALYETALGRDLVTPNFRRWVKSLDAIVPVQGELQQGPGRYAQVFELRPNTQLQTLDKLVFREVDPSDGRSKPKQLKEKRSST